MAEKQNELRMVVQLSVDDLVEVELEEDDDFLKVRETLTRIGVSSKKEKTLFVDHCCCYFQNKSMWLIAASRHMGPHGTARERNPANPLHLTVCLCLCVSV